MMNPAERNNSWMSHLFLVLKIGTAVAIVSLDLWLTRTGNRAESYPTRGITLIVPFGPGGGTDTYARIFQKAIRDNHLLDQPLVILNVGGAGATIGSRKVRNKEPDGYTALILHDAIVSAQCWGTVSYGPEDFEPIAATGEVGMVIAVREDSPFQGLKDLLNAAEKNPDTVRFGANIGALTHFAGLELENVQPGVQFRFGQIGGGAARYEALLGKHIEVTGFSIEEFVHYRPAGLRGLAYFGAERHPATLDVATAREQGVDIVSKNTFYWWFPKGTPADRVDFMANVLKQAVESEYVQKKMAAIHCTPIFLRGDALQERIAATSQRLSNVKLRRTTQLPNFPAILGTILVVLAIVCFVRRARADDLPNTTGHQKTQLQIPPAKPSQAPNRIGLALTAVVLTTLFVFSIAVGWATFRIASTVFLMTLGVTLTRSQWKKHLVSAACLALTLAFGLHLIFTRVFVIDLP